jgi:OFA family oxalate/formate antiporter-like MFS transporter
MYLTKKRFIPVISSIFIQLCLGIAYIWSVFQTGIAESIFQGDHAAAGLTFSLLLAMLTIGSVIGGKLAEKISTRAVVLIGGILLSSGFLLASFVSSRSPWTLWLTYGVMGGIGMGFTYSTTIACAQKWFPHKKGLVTGLIVSALGFGGVVFTPIVEWLIQRFGGQGVGEPKTFFVLSIIFLVVCTIGGIFLFHPPVDISKEQAASENASEVALSPRQMLKKPQYYLLTAAMMLSCIGGLMMIGFAKPIAVAKGLTETATMGVLIISVCNSFGRLFWGFISDRIGRRPAIMILTVGSAICSLFVTLAQGYAIYVLIGLIGFFYGGILGTFPVFTADLFGSKNVAVNYGFVLLGFGAGAVISSSVAGYYKNLAGQDISKMTPAFLIAAACASVAFLCILILKIKGKKSLSSAQNSSRID